MLPLVAAVAVAAAIHQLVPVAIRSPSAPPAAALDLQVCFRDATWVPPPASAEAAHLAADPRYKGLDPSKIQLERIHVEGGPFRSASAFGDFIQLSGLWNDATALQSMACPEDFHGKVELWALALRFDRADSVGPDVNVLLHTQAAGVEVAQVPLPSGSVAMHFLDSSGAKLAPDVNLGSG